MNTVDLKSPKVSEKTKNCLLEAAKKLFAKKGFSGVSVKEICSKAKVNICSVSYHFGGKEELYKSCVQTFAENEAGYMLKHLSEPDNWDDFIRKINFVVRSIIETAEKNPHIFTIINREIESDQEIILDIFEKTFHQVFLRIRSLIIYGKEKKWIHPDISESVATLSLIGTVMHIIRGQKLQKRFLKVSLKDDNYKEEVISNVVHIFINGIQFKGVK